MSYREVNYADRVSGHSLQKRDIFCYIYMKDLNNIPFYNKKITPVLLHTAVHIFCHILTQIESHQGQRVLSTIFFLSFYSSIYREETISPSYIWIYMISLEHGIKQMTIFITNFNIM